ncbi:MULTISPECIES: DUF2062 domain-containing protein [unclassified Meridianimarinicoccus]|uniref:DUF2062 domain-containing protein n=1 Tax=unclassified Meridianimarinicoccus TaxID=2923344 RepID=UPI00299F86D7|nr:DUF2062 domain-containing protein [Fluviibacterium sp. MJW13]
MFKRRNKRSIWRIAQDSVYPRGGWSRAISYISHRLRRLPDPPARIARGIAAGVFVTFTPFFGLHMFIAALLAFLLRANVLAALLSTFVGNPLTFPLIAALSIETGELLFGSESRVPLPQVLKTFSRAFSELWTNLRLLVSGGEPHWDRLMLFFEGVFLPYLVGGLIPGLVAALLAYFLSRPVIAAYQKRRARRVYGVPRRQL